MKQVQGKDALPDLINRLLTMAFGDVTPEQFRSDADFARLLIKFCVEEEKGELTVHKSRIENAWKGVQDLLVAQAESLFHNLLVRTAEEAPEIKEFYNQTSLEDLTDCIMVSDARYVDFGGYATVYETNLVRPHLAPRKVAVKVLRIYQNQVDDNVKLSTIRRRLRREIRVWQGLRHRNVIPLLGLTHRFNNSPLPSMVCPWMESGTLTSYLRRDLTLGERFKLLMDVIDGLSYLHSESVIHGDLTSANVLISENNACLSDFGLSKVISQFPGTSYMTSEIAGAARWAAPELYRMTFDIDGNQEQVEVTKACDIYSYGCIVQEVISREQPYFNIKDEFPVVLQKMTRTPPLRPPGPLLSDEIWSFIQLCWRDRPGQRPEASQVAKKIQSIYQSHSFEALEAKLPMEWSE
ncbi:hypothetical protein GALMADRAFT_783839 [Galerina marginata CBS 339.88]|uniref:Protein kinase domain-containing protein n=1 Tax=Galerina marginata (strain CBS 339.88) TaxID=685588 RepID=A0A067SPC9_GALM3|nr:hypothetical protein GALMADRAFT_783839 [Galerina marginata CBS 339.88]